MLGEVYSSQVVLRTGTYGVENHLSLLALGSWENPIFSMLTVHTWLKASDFVFVEQVCSLP